MRIEWTHLKLYKDAVASYWRHIGAIVSCSQHIQSYFENGLGLCENVFGINLVNSYSESEPKIFSPNM